jgi:hypothetical protein
MSRRTPARIRKLFDWLVLSMSIGLIIGVAIWGVASSKSKAIANAAPTSAIGIK